MDVLGAHGSCSPCTRGDVTARGDIVATELARVLVAKLALQASLTGLPGFSADFLASIWASRSARYAKRRCSFSCHASTSRSPQCIVDSWKRGREGGRDEGKEEGRKKGRKKGSLRAHQQEGTDEDSAKEEGPHREHIPDA